MNLDKITEKYHEITKFFIENNLTVATMESCTGGLIGVLLSDCEGASAVVRGGIFSYTNSAKVKHGVSEEIIDKYGVYSAETATAMAAAVRADFSTDIGIGVTGSIGTKDPNNSDSVPNEVYICIDFQGEKNNIFLTLPDDSRMQGRLAIAEKIYEDLQKYFSIE